MTIIMIIIIVLTIILVVYALFIEMASATILATSSGSCSYFGKVLYFSPQK